MKFDDARKRHPQDKRAQLPKESQAIPFAGRYKILSCIGSGGMGAVYLAKHELMNRMVALKLMLPNGDDEEEDATSLARFQQEAQALSQLTHPNIVTVFDFGVSEDGMPFMAMEYIDGTSLAQILKENGPLEPLRLLRIVSQACDALEVAHDRGVIHRDIKPSNFIITKASGKELLKVVDFGLAKVVPEDGEPNVQLTKAGEAVGSPPYMSPEQCFSRPLDRRSDIYSLGCVMFEALAGKPPFSGATYVEVAHKHCTQVPPSLATIRGDIKNLRFVEGVILKAMAKEPAKRFSSMQDLKMALEQAVSQMNTGWLSIAKTLWTRRRD